MGVSIDKSIQYLISFSRLDNYRRGVEHLTWTVEAVFRATSYIIDGRKVNENSRPTDFRLHLPGQNNGLFICKTLSIAGSDTTIHWIIAAVTDKQFRLAKSYPKTSDVTTVFKKLNN